MPALCISSWNVRTMDTGLSDSLNHINDSHKTAIINRELNRLSVDIAALRETQLADHSYLKEQNYKFFGQSNSVDKTREYGVGFALKNTLLSTAEPLTGGSECIFAIYIFTSSGPANLLSIYALTLCSPLESKEKF
eukprot:superscaffoldBa00000068_g1093